MAQDLFALVAGHVQQVVAGVGHGQVMFTHRGGLDDDSQAFHAVDGDAVAARQEHWEHGTDTKRKCIDLKCLKTAVQRLKCFTLIYSQVCTTGNYSILVTFLNHICILAKQKTPVVVSTGFVYGGTKK